MIPGNDRAVVFDTRESEFSREDLADVGSQEIVITPGNDRAIVFESCEVVSGGEDFADARKCFENFLTPKNL